MRNLGQDGYRQLLRNTIGAAVALRKLVEMALDRRIQDARNLLEQHIQLSWQVAQGATCC